MISADLQMVRATREVAELLGKPASLNRYCLRYLCFYLTYFFFAATAIAAQSIVPDDVLLFRKRAVSNYLPVGVQVGGFLISPGVGINGTFDDNIFRTAHNRSSDFITTVKPAIAVQSNWDRHNIFFGAEGDFGFYQHHSSENYEDYGVMLSGQYDFTDDTYMILALSRAQRHISRGTQFDPDASAPSEYEVSREQFQFVHELGMLQFQLHGQNEDVRLLDSTVTGVPLTSFTTRDGQEIGAKIQFEYMPDNDIYSDVTYDTNSYTLAGGSRRDADGYDVKTGWEFDTAGILRGGLYGIYINRDYSANTGDTSHIYPGASIAWDITKLTTLSGTYDTRFDETTVAGAAGVIRTERKLALKQGLTERISAEISSGLNDYKYVGGEGSINHTTEVRYHGIESVFRADEHIGITVGYNFQKRKSPLASDAYTDNLFSLGVTYMY